MLKNILKEIYTSRLFSKTDISKSLNISEEIIDSGIDQLIRMGYLMEEMGSPTCESKCSSCAYSRCSTIPIKMFTVTEKGKKILEEN
ncbi:MAG: FeoC-like transcriptional regulator [Tissierellaceae bacterium]|nr:FeoC-like transcriptional regulator [Tissierellaceae bacterium]